MPRYRTDEQLLAEEDGRGFAELYERRYPLIRGYIRRHVGPRPDLVLDLVAETFARALAGQEKYDPDRGTAVVWLLGIAHNLLADAARRGRVDDRARHSLGMQRLIVDDDQLELVERESSSDLQRSLGELPAEQREAVEARVLREEPYPMIASRVGCSEQVVRKRVSRGLAALRQHAKEGA